MLKRFDHDDSDALRLNEFIYACRNDLGIHSRDSLSEFLKGGAGVFSRVRQLAKQHQLVTIESEELERIFAGADHNGIGVVSLADISQYLSQPADPTVRTARQPWLALQAACQHQVDAIGWGEWFASHDADGSGELSKAEFRAVIRTDGGVSEEAVADESLDELFDAVDLVRHQH